MVSKRGTRWRFVTRFPLYSAWSLYSRSGCPVMTYISKPFISSDIPPCSRVGHHMRGSLSNWQNGSATSAFVES